LGGTIVSTGKITAPDGRVTIVSVPGTSRLRLNAAGNLLGLEILPISTTPQLLPLTLPQLITGGNLDDANGVVVRDGVVKLTGASQPIGQGDIALNIVKTGSALFQADRQFQLNSLSSPNDPTIRASGDVNLGNYTGASLHVLAGGNVTAGDLTITGPDLTGNGLTEAVTLSDGSIFAIDGNQRPTLDIRAGTTRFTPTGIAGAFGALNSNGNATGSNITIGNITFTTDNAQLFLTNRYAPNPNLTAGSIATGNITTTFGNTLIGTAVVIDAQTNLTTGAIDTAALQTGGDVKLLAGNNLLFSTIDTAIVARRGTDGGNVALFANGTIRGVGIANNQTINTGGLFGTPGTIAITHNGGPNNQPFIVGDASLNGTAGAVNAGASSVPVITPFPNPIANPAPGINLTFNNVAPTIVPAIVSFATSANQPIQLTFTALQALVQDADGDNTTLQIGSIGPGTLTRNGIGLTAGTVINPGDILTYTSPLNVLGAVNALSLIASDGIATSAPVNIPVTVGPIANVIPTNYANQASPYIQTSQTYHTFVPLGQRLPVTTRISDLAIFSRMMPEYSFVIDLPISICGGGPCTVYSGSYNPGQIGPNSDSRTGIYTITSNDPNTPNVSPALLPPGTPNVVLPEPSSSLRPSGPIATNPNPNGANPIGGPTAANSPISLPNCQAQIEQIKKRRVADRVESVYQQVRKCFEQQLSIAEKANAKALQTYALGNLATTAYVLGDYVQAIADHEQQAKIAQADNNPVGVGMALAGIGAAHGALGDYRKAIEYYNQALSRLPENQAPQWHALVLRNLGNASLVEKEFTAAIKYQQRSLTISQRIGDRYGEAQAYSNLGNVYTDRANFSEAIVAYKQSLEIAQSIGDRLQEAQSLLGLGTTYTYQCDFATAVGYHQRSLELMRELQARLGEGITLNNLGDSLFRLRRLDEAATALKSGIAVWESLRAGLGNNDAFKVSIFETQLNTYRNLQETLVAQNQPAPALEIAERSRARAFLELLARRRNATNDNPTVPPPTIAQIRQLAIAQKSTIVQYSIIRDQFVETPHGGAAQFTAEAKETALFIWVVQPTGNVAFRQVNLGGRDQLPIAQLIAASRNSIGTRTGRGISKATPGKTSFAPGEFVRRKGESPTGLPSQVLAVNPTDRTVILKPPTGQTQSAVPIDQLDRAESSQTQFYQFQQLYAKLIAPIADLLPTNPDEKVVFVPQEQLFLVPFAALQNPQGKFLIESHTILTVPAIQLLSLNPAKPVLIQGTNALVIGNPQPMPLDYKPLPGSAKEAQAIGTLLNVSPLIGAAATETNVKAQIAQAPIIHLATHGSFDEASPLQGAIALAPGGNEDGLLTAEEMLKLSLRADLVVLSACDTGRGRITGDGVLGLSRSWMAAGASNVLVSLWEVDDQATSALMVNFYQSLQQQPDSAIALRQSILKTMQKYPAPKDWSAFTLIGSPLAPR
jgi:CHAT domain-containing protein